MPYSRSHIFLKPTVYFIFYAYATVECKASQSVGERRAQPNAGLNVTQTFYTVSQSQAGCAQMLAIAIGLKYFLHSGVNTV